MVCQTSNPPRSQSPHVDLIQRPVMVTSLAAAWLERLLDDPDTEIGDVSGTSAGARNGAAWSACCRRVVHWSPGNARGGCGRASRPQVHYPFAMEPLRRALVGWVDAQGLHAGGRARLHVHVVNARSGACRRFGPGEPSIDALLASACAPLMSQPS